MYGSVHAHWCVVCVWMHFLIFKNVVYRFDSELTQALEEADNERVQKDKAIQECIALRAEIFSLHQTLKVRSRVKLQQSVENAYLFML